MIEPKRQITPDGLTNNFKLKFKDWWTEVSKAYPNARVFEALRTLERQKRLYGIGRTHSLPRRPVTRTMKSNHLNGNAVDIVFLDKKGNPTRVGPYNKITVLAKKYGIKSLQPTEACHFEDDGTPYKTPMNKEPALKALGEARHALNGYAELQGQVHNLANEIRAL